jgi:Peptidase_C39 like family
MSLQIFSQRDPKWANQNLGTSDVTIGGYGCIITCLSMAMTYFGVDTNPATLDNNLTDYGGYSSGNMYNFHGIEKVSNLKETASVFSDCSDSSYNAILEFIKEGINNPNKICIVQIDFVPGTSESDSHYVIVNKVTDRNNIEIIDPWTGTIRPLSDYYGATVKRPQDTIIQAFCIVGERTEEASNPNTITMPEIQIDFTNLNQAEIAALNQNDRINLANYLRDRNIEIEELKTKNQELSAQNFKLVQENQKNLDLIKQLQITGTFIPAEQSVKEPIKPLNPAIVEVKNSIKPSITVFEAFLKNNITTISSLTAFAGFSVSTDQTLQIISVVCGIVGYALSFILEIQNRK